MNNLHFIPVYLLFISLFLDITVFKYIIQLLIPVVKKHTHKHMHTNTNTYIHIDLKKIFCNYNVSKINNYNIFKFVLFSFIYSYFVMNLNIFFMIFMIKHALMQKGRDAVVPIFHSKNNYSIIFSVSVYIFMNSKNYF